MKEKYGTPEWKKKVAEEWEETVARIYANYNTVDRLYYDYIKAHGEYQDYCYGNGGFYNKNLSQSTRNKMLVLEECSDKARTTYYDFIKTCYYVTVLTPDKVYTTMYFETWKEAKRTFLAHACETDRMYPDFNITIGKNGRKNKKTCQVYSMNNPPKKIFFDFTFRGEKLGFEFTPSV